MPYPKSVEYLGPGYEAKAKDVLFLESREKFSKIVLIHFKLYEHVLIFDTCRYARSYEKSVWIFSKNISYPTR